MRFFDPNAPRHSLDHLQVTKEMAEGHRTPYNHSEAAMCVKARLRSLCRPRTVGSWYNHPSNDDSSLSMTQPRFQQIVAILLMILISDSRAGSVRSMLLALSMINCLGVDRVFS